MRTIPVEIRGLTVRFGHTLALQGLDMSIPEGEFRVILGPSGSGKTTILRSIAGLIEPEAGSIWIGGRDVTLLYPSERNVAMVFQNYALYPHMTAFNNIALNLRMRHLPRDEIDRKVTEVAELLHISPLLDRTPRELSGGEAQRVGLARAMVRDPAVYLMDEPLSNLDAKLRGEMKDELRRFHRIVQKTIIYVTHDQNEAMALGDHIVVMDRGRKQQEGTPKEVYDRPGTVFVAKFIGSPPMNMIPARTEALDRSRYRLSPEGSPAGLVLTSNGDPLPPEVQLGIRPSSIRLDPTGPWKGPVEYTELLGPQIEVHFRVGTTRVVAILPRTSAAEGLLEAEARKEVVSFAVEPASIHVFEGRTGEALGTPILSLQSP